MSSSLAVALGGAIGSLARFWIGEAFVLAGLPAVPWATLLVNVTGSFVIALAVSGTMADGRWPLPETVRLLLTVGFCGGYTTFSSFSLQTIGLMAGGRIGLAIANIVLSVVACLIAAWAGHAAGVTIARA